MTSLSRSSSAVELYSTLHDDPNATSPSSSGINPYPSGPNIPEILLEVDAFITQYKLFVNRNSIRKGALLFYRPRGISKKEEDDFLGNSEKHGDMNGKKPGSWRVLTICFAQIFLSTFVGASYDMKGVPTHLKELESSKGFWKAVLYSSISPLLSAAISFWILLILDRYWGRLAAHRVAAVLALIGFLGNFILRGRAATLVTDFSCSISTSILATTTILYLSEATEASKRNRAMIIYSFGSTPFRGIAQLILASESPILIFIFSVLAVFLVLAVSTTSPESPYWLAMKGQVPAAFDSLRGLRDTEVIAARDLYNIYVIDDPTDSNNDMFTWPKLSSRPIELVTNRRLNKLVLTITLLITTGLFSLTEMTLVLTSFGQRIAPEIALVPFICSFVLIFATPFLLPRIGLRRMLIGSLCGMLVFRLGISPSFSGQTQAVINLISIWWYFTISVAAVFVLAMYITEAFPLYYRGMGIAFVMSFYQACECIVSTIAGYETALGEIPSRMPIFILLIISIVMASLFVKETTKLPLECIGPALDPLPHGLLSYQAFVHLPYLFRRYILRRDIEIVPFEEHTYSEGAIALDTEYS